MIGLSDVVLRMWGGFAADPVLASISMFIFMMVLNFLLGFPFEWIEICLIVLPVFAPILMQYDFSGHLGEQRYLMAWFGTLVAVNLQTSFMTPPFGATLFYMKGTAPPGVTMSDVYRGMYPFVALQLVGLGLCIYYPSIVLWLPGLAGLLD
jgi:TRAP-type mannitol/chloroaromatic compound transport system permease large subunit